MAAADYAENNGAPPRELELMFECRDFDALPQAGGVWDQPAGLIRRMRRCYQTWYVFTSFYDAKSWRKWADEHPNWQRHMTWVEELRRRQKAEGGRQNVEGSEQ